MTGGAIAKPRPRRSRRFRTMLIFLGVLGVIAGGVAIFVRGRRTKEFPAVVHLSGPYCSGVAIGPAEVLTAEHCHAAAGSHIWDGEQAHVATTSTLIAACQNELAIWRVTLDSDRVLFPLVPSDADLVDGVAVDVVGFGAWPLRIKGHALGNAYDAAPKTWKAKLSAGRACKGDSGGAGFTVKDAVPRLAGIIEGGVGSITAGCADDVLLHRLNAAAITWVTQSIAGYSGTTITTCP